MTKFQKFEIPRNKLTDENMGLKIECYEITKNKANNLLGEVELPLKTVLEKAASPSQTQRIISINKNGLLVGNILLLSVDKITRYSFLNYIYSGTEISVIAAVDFSNSNKDQNDKDSYHYTGDPN